MVEERKSDSTASPRGRGRGRGSISTPYVAPHRRLSSLSGVSLASAFEEEAPGAGTNPHARVFTPASVVSSAPPPAPAAADADVVNSSSGVDVSARVSALEAQAPAATANPAAQPANLFNWNCAHYDGT